MHLLSMGEVSLNSKCLYELCILGTQPVYCFAYCQCWNIVVLQWNLRWRDVDRVIREFDRQFYADSELHVGYLVQYAAIF